MVTYAITLAPLVTTEVFMDVINHFLFPKSFPCYLIATAQSVADNEQ